MTTTKYKLTNEDAEKIILASENKGPLDHETYESHYIGPDDEKFSKLASVFKKQHND